MPAAGAPARPPPGQVPVRVAPLRGVYYGDGRICSTLLARRRVHRVRAYLSLCCDIPPRASLDIAT
eukprot:COSAG01_NODE_1483_length_10158_cov_38.218290_2_plen_66_part_00